MPGRKTRPHRRNPGRQGQLTTEFVRGVSVADLDACENAGSFLQSAMWGRFKSRFGWGAKAFLVEWAPGETIPLLTLSRRVAPGIRMAYVPWGPELPAGYDPGQRVGALAELAGSLRRFLPGDTTFIRFDPPWPDADGAGSPIAPLVRAAADIQPPDTVIVDLRPDAGDILASMKPKWRYNIGLAGKRGVTVRPATDPGRDLDVFYQLLAETAERDGIAVHGAGYYRALFDECHVPGNDVPPGTVPATLRLYTAWHDDSDTPDGGECLAAVVVLCRGDRATYLYGASSNAKRNLMAPYALQWRAMLDAKAAGCTGYDLFGIPPDGDPGHPMAGLYRFKTGFGGDITRRPGSWDYPIRPIPHALFAAAERFRKNMRDRRKPRGGKS